jgi:SAM-dependent methyltransferase
MWIEQLSLSTDDTLSKHLQSVRAQAWQEVQEHSIGRWWFLKNRLQMNPYYSDVIKLAREGASIADLACGFGQDSRWLCDDGATGKLYAVDLCLRMWELGLQLFHDTPGPAEFIHADIFTDSENPCGLHVLHNKVDIFLLNDFLSFLGNNLITSVLVTVVNASKPGSRIVGWMFGINDLDEMGLDSPRIWGDGMRGVIHHPDAFRQRTWKNLEDMTKTRWDLQLHILEPEEFGFDAGELGTIWKLFPLKVLCFMAIRLS